jgi:dCTP diphosphatase
VTFAGGHIASRLYGDDVFNPEVRDEVLAFVAERDWEQFHSPENLAKSIAIEAGELLECFQWSGDEFDVERVRDELADVLTYCTLLAARIGADPAQIVRAKLADSRAKYPAERARGRSTKYDAL